MVAGYKLTSNYNLSAAGVRMYNPALFANKGQKNRVKKQYLMSVILASWGCLDCGMKSCVKWSGNNNLSGCCVSCN